jgi:hypothetical protein
LIPPSDYRRDFLFALIVSELAVFINEKRLEEKALMFYCGSGIKKYILLN